jgi:hypothetical protein
MNELAPLQAQASLPTDSERLAGAALAKANSMSIATDADYETAAGFANDIRAMQARLDAERISLKADFLLGCQKIDGYFRGPIAACESAFKAVKGAMIAYDDRKKREREAEEARQREERRKAEAEAQARVRAEEEARREAQRTADLEARAKLEAAEADARREREARLQAEARQRGDAEELEKANKRAAEAEADAKRARDQALADREAAIEARRRQNKAEAQTAAATAAVGKAAETVAADPVKVSGVARKTVWKWRLKQGADLQAMIQDNIIPVHYLKLDADKIDATVERLKDLAQNTLPWLEIYSESELAIGKKRV